MNYYRFWIPVITGLLATLLWNYSFLYPLKLLIVLVHEMWHGMAALVAGANLDEIVINLHESGETRVSGLYSQSGFILSVSAGYIGSTLTGALLVNRGLMGSLERVTLLTLAFILSYMSILFTVTPDTVGKE